MNRSRSAAVAVVVVALVGIGVVLFGRGPAETPAPRSADVTPAGRGGQAGSEKVGTPRVVAPELLDDDAGVPTPRGAAVVARFGWGSGEGQLGRSRPQEGNPEAPMSLTIDPRGGTLVLDQVNQRLIKLDRNGKPAGTVPLPLQAAQDVVVAKDGTVAVMDRLVDRSVALLGPDGKQVGELKLEGKNLPEGGGITGVFADGDHVYAEREHADLVRLGTTKGVTDPERGQTPGRPTRDGSAFLTAGLVSGQTGLVTMTVIDRVGSAHRFTRQYSLGSALLAIVLLDSDASGVVYLGLLGATAASTPEAPRFAIAVLCLDARDGKPLGRIALPANDSPEETFRELAVPEEGGVMFLHRTEAGAQLERYQCQ